MQQNDDEDRKKQSSRREIMLRRVEIDRSFGVAPFFATFFSESQSRMAPTAVFFLQILAPLCCYLSWIEREKMGVKFRV
jgi:hypothetical protein